MRGWGRGACAIARGRRHADHGGGNVFGAMDDIFRAMDDVFHIMLSSHRLVLAILYAHSIYHPYDYYLLREAYSAQFAYTEVLNCDVVVVRG